MKIRDALLILSSLPSDLEIVFPFGMMYKEITGFSLRDANLFHDGSLWRPTHHIHVKDGQEVLHEKIKIVEIEFSTK